MLDITDVLLNDGRQKTCETEFGLAALSYKTGDYPVLEKTPVKITVWNKGESKLQLSGEVQLELMFSCARCLAPTRRKVEISFDFETNGNESEYIDGYYLDVDQLVHDEAMLVWPERVLCREDCLGLCSVCGHNQNDGPCGCDRTDRDPRMAKILDIFNTFKEV